MLIISISVHILFILDDIDVELRWYLHKTCDSRVATF